MKMVILLGRVPGLLSARLSWRKEASSLSFLFECVQLLVSLSVLSIFLFFPVACFHFV